MSTQNYPGNSKSRGPSKPKIERIVTSEARTKKRPLGKRVIETFAGEDVPSIGQYLLFEIIIPGLRDILYDAGTGGWGQLLGVNNRRRPSTGGPRTGPSHIPYESFSKNTSIMTSKGEPVHRVRRDTDYFILNTRAEAEEVLNQMRALLDQYENVTVADLKSYIGRKVEFTDESWGWKDLREARIVRDHDGYILDFPRTVEIR